MSFPTSYRFSRKKPCSICTASVPVVGMTMGSMEMMHICCHVNLFLIDLVSCNTDLMLKRAAHLHEVVRGMNNISLQWQTNFIFPSPHKKKK